MAKKTGGAKSGKGHVPIKVLEKRAQKLVNIIKTRGGHLPKGLGK